MKIAITAKGKTLDDKIDPRFGRCPYFLIVDTDTMDIKAVENSNAVLGGGAGIQSGKLMADNDVKYVLTGNCGPNAFNTLDAAGIKVVTGCSGTARESVKQFVDGDLTTSEGSNVERHSGQASA